MLLLNHLNLGPFHDRLQSHIKDLIERPELLLDPTSPASMATLDGKEFDNPRAVASVHEQLSQFPSICPLLLGFLKGSLETWERFSSQFASDGLIRSLSDSEKDLAFMPATNDANEGALGQWRVFARAKPNSTIQHFSGASAFFRNDTQAFMDAKFQADDHQYIMRQARALDANGSTKKFQEELLGYQQNIATSKREKIEQWATKLRELMDRLRGVTLITHSDKIRALKNAEIDEQLDVYRRVIGDTEVPKKCQVKVRALKLDALFEAVDRQNEYGAQILYYFRLIRIADYSLLRGCWRTSRRKNLRWTWTLTMYRLRIFKNQILRRKMEMIWL
jgi:hypothetical protein